MTTWSSRRPCLISHIYPFWWIPFFAGACYIVHYRLSPCTQIFRYLDIGQLMSLWFWAGLLLHGVAFYRYSIPDLLLVFNNMISNGKKPPSLDLLLLFIAINSVFLFLIFFAGIVTECFLQNTLRHRERFSRWLQDGDD